MIHRKDIQSLRAVAVIMVVLYHLKIPGFNSGLLGVDLFFVISGFLMERLYDPEVGPMAFYMRRAKRLLPAYFVTVFSVVVSAFFVTLPPEFSQVNEQAVYASLFSSNIGFWTREGYFNKLDFSPMLHLWSLGVEIQFYLIIPFILALRQKLGVWFLPSLISISGLLCLIFLALNPKTAFLAMPTRMWEFGFGMLAAQCSGGAPKNRFIGSLAALGIMATMFMPVTGDIKDAVRGHPGLPAFAMCLATALTLWGGIFDRLCSRLLEGVGNWSYSLYLAHFPIIVMMNYEPFSGTNLGGISAIPVIVFGAFLLYRYFERGGYFSARAMVAASGMLATLGLILTPLQALRFDPTDKLIFSALTDRGPFRCGRLFRFLHPNKTMCALSEGSRGHVLLIGDSRSDSIKQAFVDIARENGYGVRFALSNNPLIERDYGPEWLEGEATKASAVFYHYTPENYGKARIPQLDVPSILIPFTPEATADVPAALYQARHDSGPLPQISGNFPGLCVPECMLSFRGRPLYFDKHHLTLTGAELTKPTLRRIFEQILPPAKH